VAAYSGRLAGAVGAVLDFRSHLGGGLVGVGGGLSWWVGVAGVEKKVKGVGHAWVGEWGLFFIKIKKSKNLTTVNLPTPRQSGTTFRENCRDV
jgi:hypothetical protein